jgi:hypothetical protein
VKTSNPKIKQSIPTLAKLKKTVEQEANSIDHQCELRLAFQEGQSFQSKTSLTPRSSLSVNPLDRGCSNPSTSTAYVTPFSTFGKPRTLSSKDLLSHNFLSPNHKGAMEPIREGMEDGYSVSPMAKLCLEFDQDLEHNVSTYASVSLLATKTTLNPEDIEDRGVSKSSDEP